MLNLYELKLLNINTGVTTKHQKCLTYTKNKQTIKCPLLAFRFCNSKVTVNCIWAEDESFAGWNSIANGYCICSLFITASSVCKLKMFYTYFSKFELKYRSYINKIYS